MFIYSGIFKSLYVYYQLPAPIALLLYLLLCVYHLLYILAAVFLQKRLRLSVYAFAVLFAAFEFARNRFLYGFPIGNLNLLVYDLPWFTKSAAWFGATFVTFEIVLVNAAFYRLLRRSYLKPALVFLMIGIFAMFHVFSGKGTGRVDIHIVQGNIPQNEKWEDSFLNRNLHIYIRLTKQLKGLVFWPESAYPYLFDPYTFPYDSLPEKVSVIFGAVRLQKNHYYNSVIYIKNRKVVAIYNKQRLVPFAEFIPLRWLIGRFVPENMDPGDFTAGKSGVLFTYKGLSIGSMICYEEAFGFISRWYKRHGANLLAVFTNDAWFDGTPTFFMLHRNAIYRAIENRIWLVRVANTGISEVVSPSGKIVAKAPVDKMYVLGYRIPVYKGTETIYDRFGYLSGWFFLLMLIPVIFYETYRSRKEAKQHPATR